MQLGTASHWERQLFMGDFGPRPSRPGTETQTVAIRAADRASFGALVDEGATDDTPQTVHVYIVEDSPIVQRLLASAVEGAGAKLSGSTDDAQAAIGDVFALQPDLILIDIGLASGCGFDVLRALRDHSLAPAAIKVVLSNYGDAEYRDRSVSLGADRFFDKSFETPQALALIDAIAAEGRSRASPLL